jgi:NAD(P)-dependent dehydrogenase (short-subunit alcohol dehydrogenase family)
VSRRVDCERIIAEILADFGRIDVLVNNAAIRTESPGSVFWRMEADQWLRIAHTNSDSVFLMSREVVGGMIARGFGKIVNVSTNGRTMAREMFTPYGPSKAFVEACTRAWSAELSGTGVTMNVLLPGGAVDTSAHGCGSEELDVRTLPAAIMVPPLLWLASDESNACSGQRLVASLWNETRQLNDRIADATQGGIIVPTIM